MKNQCFDEGTIQAFLDGELAPDLLEKVACHIALCDTCALLLEETEEESAFAFAALDNEFNTLVPTERIRTNLYQAISEIEKPKTSSWKSFFNFSGLFSNPMFAAFASLVIVATVSFALLNSKENTVNQPSLMAGNISKIEVSSDVNQGSTKSSETTTNVSGQETMTKVSVSQKEIQPKFQKAVYRIPTNNQVAKKVGETTNTVAPVSNEAIAGEQTYVKTIAALTETVNSQKDQILRPSSRVAFEKDMAIADDTIARMKKEVKKNPKNEAAKQVLRNSYQNKIDLLNSVTERTELMATLK